MRRAYGALCGCVGIALNLLLFACKLLAGFLSASIAITADAFNNLSDAGSSVVTLLGFHLAAKAPDRDHPFGHGRLEYVSGLVVSMVIILMGVELGKGSLEKILRPQPVDFSVLAAAILAASIAVKLYMAFYNRTVGRRISSAAMAATAADSLSDSLATGAVLLGSLAGHFLHWQIDGWCGALVALFIAARLKDAGLPVIGIHDLMVHDYGPGRRIVSLHAEVPASGDILALHDVVDAAEHQLGESMGCLATIHMDPVVTDCGLTAEARERVSAIVRLIDPGISIHDFRMVPGPTHTKVIFDAEVPYDCRLPLPEIRERIQAGVRALDGSYSAVVEMERSYI